MCAPYRAYRSAVGELGTKPSAAPTQNFRPSEVRFGQEDISLSFRGARTLTDSAIQIATSQTLSDMVWSRIWPSSTDVCSVGSQNDDHDTSGPSPMAIAMVTVIAMAMAIVVDISIVVPIDAAIVMAEAMAATMAWGFPPRTRETGTHPFTRPPGWPLSQIVISARPVAARGVRPSRRTNQSLWTTMSVGHGQPFAASTPFQHCGPFSAMAAYTLLETDGLQCLSCAVTF